MYLGIVESSPQITNYANNQGNHRVPANRSHGVSSRRPIDRAQRMLHSFVASVHVKIIGFK